MGLISRVSSRTYRFCLKKILFKKPKMSQAVVWSIVRQNNSYLVKSRKNDGVQFSKHPANLKNKNTLKWSGIANANSVAIQANGKALSMALGGKKVASFNTIRGSRPIVNKAGNAVGRYNPALKTAAKKRVSALLKAQN